MSIRIVSLFHPTKRTSTTIYNLPAAVFKEILYKKAKTNLNRLI